MGIVATAQDLGRSYPDGGGVRGLNFDISRGEVVGLLGRNGAGKTTTIRLLLGLVNASSGGAELFPEVQKLSPTARKSLLGYLPEHFAPPGDLTSYELLELCARLRGVSRRDCRAYVERVCEMFSLSEFLHKRCCILSKGQRQRVGLAQSFVHRPQFVVLDEPTSGLDPEQAQQFRECLRSCALAGTAFLVSTHVLPEVASLCTRLMILERGALVADVTDQQGFSISDVESCFHEARQVRVPQPGEHAQGVGG